MLPTFATIPCVSDLHILLWSLVKQTSAARAVVQHTSAVDAVMWIFFALMNLVASTVLPGIENTRIKMET
jgi:hypothetical protein